MDIKRVILFSILFIFFIYTGSASLGISPAIVNIDYASGREHVINYNVISDNPDAEIEIYVSGDLAQYVKLSKDKIVGAGGFTLKINLPDNIETPGMHSISVSVKEKPPENFFIGTAIVISGAIKIFVPYPGRYAEVSLNIPNGNVDEEIPVETHVINRGKEKFNAYVHVNFFTDSRNFVGDMVFSPVELEPGTDRYFRRFLNTTGLKPGNYFAEVIVNYGEEAKINKTFRIGSLFVNITNFTEELPQEGIQKFFVNIESKWNGDLQKVYADVNLSNSTKSMIFRTPSVDLKAWESEILAGFLDTDVLKGQYKTEIILNYAGEKSFAYGKLDIIKKGLSTILIIGGAIAMVVLVLVIIIIWKFRRNSLSNVRVWKNALRGKK